MSTIKISGKELVARARATEITVKADSVFIGDIPQNSNQRFEYLEDFVNVFDICSIDPRREMESQIATVTDEHRKAFLKLLVSDATAGDQISIDVDKMLLEDAETIDILMFDFVKSILDAAVTQDAISLEFVKTLMSTAVTDDTVALNFEKVVQDTLESSDELLKDVEIVKADVLTTGDVISFVADFKRDFTHIASTSELIAFHLSRAFRDDAGATDGLRLTFNKVTIDTVANSDTVRKNLQKLLGDMVDATDAISKHIYKNFIDHVNVESVFPVMFLGTTQDLSTIATAYDMTLLNIGKGIVSNVETSEAIELYNQSYFAEGYSSGKYAGELYNF